VLAARNENGNSSMPLPAVTVMATSDVSSSASEVLTKKTDMMYTCRIKGNVHPRMGHEGTDVE